MLDHILEILNAIALVVYYFITQLNFLLVFTSLLILFFMQKTPPFVVFGHKPPVIINPKNPLWEEVKKYQKLAALRWFLVLVIVCFPLLGVDPFTDITTILIGACLLVYSYKAGFLLRLDGMAELGFVVKNNVMEVHLQNPASTFRKKTYTELTLLMDACVFHGVNKITMKSPMFYKSGSLRQMDRITKIAESNGWDIFKEPVRLRSFSLVLASVVMFLSPRIRSKVNPFVWHCITLEKSCSVILHD